MLRKLLSFSLILMILLGSFGCTIDRFKNGSPSDTVEQFSQAMQQLDFDKMASFMKNPAVLQKTADLDDPNMQALLPVFQLWAKDITYSIQEPSVSGGNATVTATYTYNDASAVLPNVLQAYTAKALELTLGGADQAEIEQALPEIIREQTESTDLKQAKIQVTYSVEYGDGKWLIVSMPAELLRPLTSDFLLLQDDLPEALQALMP